MLNIEKKLTESKLEVALIGRLDTTTAPELEKELKESLDGVNELVFEMTGQQVRVLRCPYGSFNSTLRRVCADLGMVIASWQTDTLDWSTRNTKKTYRSLVNNAENGNIFLMHDLYPTTAEAVIQAIPVLVGGGYQLVTVSELLSFHKEGIIPGTVYMHLDPANIVVR